MRHLILILLAFLLLSCKAYHCRKCLEGATLINDTITVRDTIVTTRRHVDTLFSFQKVHVYDTIIKRDGKAIVRYVKLPGDTVYVGCECESDTLYIEKQVPVITKIKVSTGWGSARRVILLALIGALIGAVLAKMFSK